MPKLWKVSNFATLKLKTQLLDNRAHVPDFSHIYYLLHTGLKLDDPVQAFFDFCKERESIRLKREKGEPSPWTDDKVWPLKGFYLNLNFVKTIFEVSGGNCEKMSKKL